VLRFIRSSTLCRDLAVSFRSFFPARFRNSEGELPEESVPRLLSVTSPHPRLFLSVSFFICLSRQGPQIPQTRRDCICRIRARSPTPVLAPRSWTSHASSFPFITHRMSKIELHGSNRTQLSVSLAASDSPRVAADSAAVIRLSVSIQSRRPPSNPGMRLTLDLATRVPSLSRWP